MIHFIPLSNFLFSFGYQTGNGLRLQVAIKRMKQKFSQWSETFDHREVQAIQALSNQSCCSHLVRIHEIIREDDSTLYFVCEYMPDGTLNDFVTKTLERGDRIESTLITSILRQVLHGLEHMHSKGYMHRDLKPEVSVLTNLCYCGSMVRFPFPLTPIYNHAPYELEFTFERKGMQGSGLFAFAFYIELQRQENDELCFH